MGNQEKQCLADHHLQILGAKRLGDQEGGLRARTGKEPLRVGCHENHRHRKAAQNFLDRIEAELPSANWISVIIKPGRARRTTSTA